MSLKGKETHKVSMTRNPIRKIQIFLISCGIILVGELLNCLPWQHLLFGCFLLSKCVSSFFHSMLLRKCKRVHANIVLSFTFEDFLKHDDDIDIVCLVKSSGFVPSQQDCGNSKEWNKYQKWGWKLHWLLIVFVFIYCLQF